MELVINGDFSQGNLHGWHPVNVDFVQSKDGGGRFTLTNSTGGILQLLNTKTLKSYKLSFIIAHEGASEIGVFEVFWNGVSILQGADLPNFHRTSFHGEVTALSDTSELLFAFTVTGGRYIIDNVSVQEKATSYPAIIHLTQ